MANRVPPEIGMAALRARLLSIAPHLSRADGDRDAQSTSAIIAELAASVRSSGSDAELWMLMTGVCGVMPTREQFISLRRAIQLADAGAEFTAVLDGCIGPARLNPHIQRSVAVIDDGVVVDVDFCARHGHNSGIQRVVRETVRRWSVDRELVLTAWTDDGGILRTLAPVEHDRVVGWASEKMHDRSGIDADDDGELVIPWRSVIVLPEVASLRVWNRLACAAEFSGNTTVLVGYDAIPVTSAEYVIPSEADRFVRYLSVVKHATRVLAISESSATEFRGFAAALQGQHLSGPAVLSIPLPVDTPTPEAGGAIAVREHTLPQVLCVGTQEPRKNQLAVLAASERLWQGGKEFELLFIGGSAVPLSLPFDAEVQRLKKRGRPITVLRHTSDSILARAYADSRFSVFISTHEGFGLPVGESLSVGTPVIATDFGSIAEIAAGGGCLLVNPRDDEAIFTAMGTLLDDDELLARLTTEALSRAPRTWDDYAREVWDAATKKVAG